MSRRSSSTAPAEMEDERLAPWDFFYVTSAEQTSPVRFPEARDAARGDAALKRCRGISAPTTFSICARSRSAGCPKGSSSSSIAAPTTRSRCATTRGARSHPLQAAHARRRLEAHPGDHALRQKAEMPIFIAPTGSAGLTWYEGEIALARAAEAAGIPFTLATGSMTAMEKVAAEAGGTLWFQLYMWPDRALSHKLVERAREAGYEALALHGRHPGVAEPRVQPAQRLHASVHVHAQERHRRAPHPRWLLPVLGRYVMTTGMPRYENFPSEMKHRSPRARWDARGVERHAELGRPARAAQAMAAPPDRERPAHRRRRALAADCGADAVIVSNHGGRISTARGADRDAA